MEEKILIKGKFSKQNALVIISAAISFIMLIYSIWWDRNIHKMGGNMKFHECIDYFTPFFAVGVPMLILAVIFYFWMSSHRLTITDKRISGKASFGKRVDLPADSVSAVGTGIFNTVSIATSSGRISFMLLKNREEILKVLGDLIIERQGKGSAQ